jgi:putative sterol carrier protein
MSETVRYLSLEWIDVLARAVADSESMEHAAAGREIGLTQVVCDGPEGEVTYHLQVDGDGIRFGAGAAEPEHVRMEQSWATAVAVATGELNAQEAFINGRIRLYGDHRRLLDAQPVFGALDAVFSEVRQRTEYA